MNQAARRNNVWSNQKGVAMLEATIVLPLLFLLIFGIFELGRIIKAHQQSVLFGREAATFVVRNCTESQVPAQMSNCIRDALTDPTVVNLMPNGTTSPSVTVSVYHMQQAGTGEPNPGQIDRWGINSYPPSNNPPTKLTPQLVGAQLQGLTNINPTVTISEVHGLMIPLTLLGQQLNIGQIYEVAAQ